MPSSNADTITLCANCGKGDESAGDLKSCTACKLVKYCNRDCQIAHRPQHKKACKKRAVELHDEALFNDPPPREECPICMLPLPLDVTESSFVPCCGKTICNGCVYAMTLEEIRKGKKDEEVSLCPYCRTPHESSVEEGMERVAKLMDNGNSDAFYVNAGYYASGIQGMPQNSAKANELWLKAGELGCVNAYYKLGNSYYHGSGVEIDKKKAKYYLELAAIKGSVIARHNLGCVEGNAGNHRRAMKHFMLAAKAGDKKSLEEVKRGFTKGYVMKDEYESTLRAYHECQAEMKSETRDKAADLAARRSDA